MSWCRSSTARSFVEDPGGGSRTATLKLHAPYGRRAGVEHNVINANPCGFAFIEIEHLKP